MDPICFVERDEYSMNTSLRHVVVFSLLGLLAAPATAATRLPSIFSDHMVLQREQPLTFWGWDDPGTDVTIQVGPHRVSVKTGDDGKWLAMLPVMRDVGPHRLKVEGTTVVEREGILVGEVWLCSGQSNMEWRVKQSLNATEEIAAANYPQIHHIKIPHTTAEKPQADVPSEGWQICSPATVKEFTAVGYYFGRQLHKELNVPIGLIGSNWGGTRIEPWTCPAGFQRVSGLRDIADRLDEYPTKLSDGRINHQSPLAIYNGMIHPLVPFALRGVIWYQGESNLSDGWLYHEKMKALIAGWRDIWSNEMPFYFVQLAPFRYKSSPERLPEIWEAQTATLSVPHTGMAVIVDVGDLEDIHPVNKQEVGRRLSLWALAKTYGRGPGMVYSGPQYKSHHVHGKEVHLHFDHVGGGLVARDGKALTHFELAGSDGKFSGAVARIHGDEVIVSADAIDDPQVVRFAWHQEAEPNLANQEGLPASPFRTDGPAHSQP